VQITPEFELATSDMIVQFALRSLGIGCVVKDFCKSQLEEGLLFELRFKTRIPKRKFCVVTSENQVLSKAAGNLLQLIQQDRKEL
jgi:LysR family transcriptional regulator, low CO2-responsive transcriptional regulator